MTSTSKAGNWRLGTVTQIIPEALGMRSYCLALDEPVQHEAGQHYELRLTAADGYQAVRLYSAAMPANGTAKSLELTIALMPHGEVSPYIFDHIKVGSQLEVRGPLGRYFIWTPAIAEPVLLIGGGAGVIPLRAIRLQHQQACCPAQLHLLYSVKTYDDMPFKYELFPRSGLPHDDITITFTGQPPAGWQGPKGQINDALVKDILAKFRGEPLVYVCGPTSMVETVSDILVAQGINPTKIKTERFGPTA